MRSVAVVMLGLGVVACGGPEVQARNPWPTASPSTPPSCDGSDGSTQAQQARGIQLRERPGIILKSVRAHTRQGETRLCGEGTLETGDAVWFELELKERLYLFALNQHRETPRSTPEDTLLYPKPSATEPEAFGPGSVRFPPAPAELALDRNTGTERLFLVASKIPPPNAFLSAEGLWEWLGETKRDPKLPTDGPAEPSSSSAGETPPTAIPTQASGGAPNQPLPQREKPKPSAELAIRPLSRLNRSGRTYGSERVYLTFVLIKHPL